MSSHAWKSTASALAMVTALVAAGTATGAQSSFETEPVLSAKDLVPAQLLKGTRFTVDDRVPVKGFVARFAIKSDFGPFEARGIRMLHVRVREIHALGQLDEMSKTKEFAAAAGRAVARPVTATAHMLVHPVDTVTGIPDGVGRLFDRVKLGGTKVAEAASASDKGGGEKAADVSKRVGGISADALGYEKERRDLAKGLGVDPYTSNPVLAKKLDDMAWVAFSGRLGIQAAVSVFVPYSMAMSAVSITDSTVYDTPGADLINQAQAAFAATGASAVHVAALMNNGQYSLSVLTALARGLQRLKGVNGLASAVEFAAGAKTQDETRLVAAAVNMLARHHEGTERIAQVTAPGPIVGQTVGGTLVVPAPVDYAAWTERAGRFAQREDLKAAARNVWLSGRMSDRARKEFARRNWKVDESFTIAAER
ncbi:MAG TPA: hypothetical protein VLK35_11600 [Methylomirabilota bacterium]|nr:hypothetical protein [Methylomirabilota bacterium]